jgi:hypothetical protein
VVERDGNVGTAIRELHCHNSDEVRAASLCLNAGLALECAWLFLDGSRDVPPVLSSVSD